MAEAIRGGTAISAAELAEIGLRYEVDGEIATITLDRPEKRNAQTFGTWSALARIGDNLPDPVRIVVVRGEGPSFSAGIDLRMFMETGNGGNHETRGHHSFASAAALDGADLEELIGEAQRGFLWLRRPDIVSIAAVQGHAIGAGFQLALACDLRVVADDARFAMLEPTLGLVPDLAGTKPLVDLVGYGRALEICATGRTVEAAEAAEIGLATVVVPAAELLDAVRDLTDALLAPPRGAVTGTKRLLQGAVERGYDEQRAAERHEQVSRLRELASAMRAS
jgi:enoyl-CoA hydratase/carnithine racemase